eukprot:465348_1
MCYFALVTSSLLFYIATVISNTYVWTPHGSRLSQCVHRATESEAIIESILNSTHDGVLVSYPLSGAHVFYPTLPECLQEAAGLSITASDHDWQQNLYQMGTPPMGSFECHYTLPNESPQGDGDIMFFIGLANKPQKDVQTTIIQPVVTYNTNNKWRMSAWNCCPNGQSHQGNVVPLPQDAKNIYGFCSSNSSHIYVTMSYDGKSSSITQPNKLNGTERIFSYVDVTLEQWYVTNCNGYTKKPFNFTNLNIKTENGAKYSPKWEKQINDTCNGGIQVNNEFNIAIWGADKPK